MAVARRDRLDPVALDLAKGVRFGAVAAAVADGSSLRWHYPVQVHAVGATRPLSPDSRAPANSGCYRRYVLAPGSGEEVGEDAVDLGVEGEADMAAVDLDRVDVGRRHAFQLTTPSVRE